MIKSDISHSRRPDTLARAYFIDPQLNAHVLSRILKLSSACSSWKTPFVSATGEPDCYMLVGTYNIVTDLNVLCKETFIWNNVPCDKRGKLLPIGGAAYTCK